MRVCLIPVRDIRKPTQQFFIADSMRASIPSARTHFSTHTRTHAACAHACSETHNRAHAREKIRFYVLPACAQKLSLFDPSGAEADNLHADMVNKTSDGGDVLGDLDDRCVQRV